MHFKVSLLIELNSFLCVNLQFTKKNMLFSYNKNMLFMISIIYERYLCIIIYFIFNPKK